MKNYYMGDELCDTVSGHCIFNGFIYLTSLAVFPSVARGKI
ncbi:unnamed protein product [Staurois parvus]|uniref:Uncharacterized protein n=1 Tax=Staurois parvus TaxID=386267 RepID=A0ABN9BTR9_9NEOB|nr:unnamed protein product [Staurois parvus]